MFCKFLLVAKNIFDLNIFMLTLIFFNYGYVHAKSKPVKTFSNSLLSSGRLKPSASEMCCLFTSIPLLIKHLVPEFDFHWELLFVLFVRNIVICFFIHFIQLFQGLLHINCKY